MNKKLNINLFFKDDGEDIIEVLTRDFQEFLNNYLQKILK